MKIAAKLVICALFIISAFFLLPSKDALANPCNSNPAEGKCVPVSELGKPFAVYQKTGPELIGLGCIAEPTISTSIFTSKEYVFQPNGMRYVIPATDPSGRDRIKFFCPAALVEQKLVDRDNLTGPITSRLVGLVNSIILIIAHVFNWIFDWSSHAMLQMISAGTYMNHPFVQSGWPFIQGVANLGFILALLFIAAATTLHLDIGGGIKRLLPRLLIAALLINFSLVIGAVIIDMSRLLMAIEVNILSRGEGSIEDFGKQILESSQLSTVVAKGADPGNHSWSIPVELAQKTLMIAALAIGMFMAAILLVIRHIALILLLLFSPIAYLAFAIPKADRLARKWWSEFLKWTMYGPILLFFIILIAFFGTGFNQENSPEDPVPFAAAAVNVGITSAMLIIAGKFGTMLAGAGGAAAISMTTRSAKRAGSWARKNPYKAAGIAGAVATGGLGAAAIGGAALGAGGVAAGKAARNQVRDFKRAGGKGFVNQYNKLGGEKFAGGAFKLGTRDKDGNLKPGERSLGQSAGRFIDPKERASKRTANNNAATIKAEISPNNKKGFDHNNIQIPTLEDRGAAQKLSSDEVSSLTTNLLNAGETNKVKALLNNPEMVNKIKDHDGARQEIYGYKDDELIKMFNNMRRRIEDADKKQ